MLTKINNYSKIYLVELYINVRHIRNIFVYFMIEYSIYSKNLFSDASSIYPCICSSIFLLISFCFKISLCKLCFMKFVNHILKYCIIIAYLHASSYVYIFYESLFTCLNGLYVSICGCAYIHMCTHV